MLRISLFLEPRFKKNKGWVQAHQGHFCQIFYIIIYFFRETLTLTLEFDLTTSSQAFLVKLNFTFFRFGNDLSPCSALHEPPSHKKKKRCFCTETAAQRPLLGYDWCFGVSWQSFWWWRLDTLWKWMPCSPILPNPTFFHLLKQTLILLVSQ